MKKTSSEELVLLGKVGSPSGLKGEVRITLYQQDSTNLKEGKVLLLKHGKEGAKEVLGSPQTPQPSQRKTNNYDACDLHQLRVERVRYQGGRPVVKLEGISDRNTAETLRGLQVYIEPEDLEPLPEGEHYVRDLIGCRVMDVAAENESLSRAQQNCSSASAPGGTLQLSKALDSEDQCFLHHGDAAMDLGSITRCGSQMREIGVLRDVIQNTAQSIFEIETPEGKTVLVPAVDEFLVEINEEERIIKLKLIPGFID